jgi:hypothetical protein
VLRPTPDSSSSPSPDHPSEVDYEDPKPDSIDIEPEQPDPLDRKCEIAFEILNWVLEIPN